MWFLFLLILYPRKTTSQCVSMQIENISTGSGLKNVSALECITYGFTQAAKFDVYWDARKRMCSLKQSVGTHEAPVVVFTLTLCEKVTVCRITLHDCNRRDDGRRERISGTIPLSECQELCRAVTTCDTATWRDNVCTINSKHKKGEGTKIILKDQNCKGRRPAVIRLFRNVDGADRENGVSDISVCMWLRRKSKCSSVDFDTNDQSCWCQKGGKGKAIHYHNSAVQFVSQVDFHNKGEVTYTEPVSGSMKCRFMIPGKVLEKTCRSLCSGLANCIAYSHSGKLQACAIHFFACRRTDDIGYTLKLVEFNKKLHRGSSKHTGSTHGQERFSCFTKMKGSSLVVESPRAPHVVSKMACAVACSQQKGCLAFTYKKINRKCATSLKAKETYIIRPC